MCGGLAEKNLLEFMTQWNTVFKLEETSTITKPQRTVDVSPSIETIASSSCANKVDTIGGTPLNSHRQSCVALNSKITREIPMDRTSSI